MCVPVKGSILIFIEYILLSARKVVRVSLIEIRASFQVRSQEPFNMHKM